MSKRLIISEDEKNEIRNKYSIVQEQITGGNTTAQDDKFITQLIDKTQELRGGLFKTGSDQVNINSPEFNQAKTELKPVGEKGYPVEIIGGASSVGADRGFDNQGLATRRAFNFKEALKNAGVKTDRMFVTKIDVGSATERNSPEALKQQYVGYTVRKPGVKIDYETAIDNTATVRQDIKRPIKIKDEEKVLTYPDPVNKDDRFFTITIHYNNKKTNMNKVYNVLKTKGIDGLDTLPGVTKISGT